MPSSSRELGEVESRVLEYVSKYPGATVSEVSEATGLSTYDVYRAVKELKRRGLVEVVEGRKYDPYSPSATREVYPTGTPPKPVARADREGGPASAPCAVLVATHPRPPRTSVEYISYLDAFDALVRESGKVEGATGYLEPNALRRLCSHVVQRRRQRFEVSLVCGKVFNEELLPPTLRELESMGVSVEVLVLPSGERSSVHAKFLVSGSLSYVGSHNITDQSVSSNLEVGVLLRDESLSSALREMLSELRRDAVGRKHDSRG